MKKYIAFYFQVFLYSLFFPYMGVAQNNLECYIKFSGTERIAAEHKDTQEIILMERKIKTVSGIDSITILKGYSKNYYINTKVIFANIKIEELELSRAHRSKKIILENLDYLAQNTAHLESRNKQEIQFNNSIFYAIKRKTLGTGNVNGIFITFPSPNIVITIYFYRVVDEKKEPILDSEEYRKLQTEFLSKYSAKLNECN